MPTAPEEPPEDDTPRVRPFADFLRELKKDKVHDELSDTLHELIAAVQYTGKPGALTFTLKVEMEKNTEMLKTTDEIKKKIPELDRGAAMWFVDDDGNFSKDNPTQLSFEGIKVVGRDQFPPYAINQEA